MGEAGRFPGPDPSQLGAIRCSDGPRLLAAGPGSGKTTVIVGRLRYLIQERGVPPERILVITFARAAAMEMRRRFLTLTGGQYANVFFSTFHSLFFQILSRERGLQADQIAPPALQLRLAGQTISRYIHILQKKDPDTAAFWNARSGYLAGQLLQEISRSHNSHTDAFSSRCFSPDQFQWLKDDYCARLSRYEKTDFDLLQNDTLALFQSDPACLARWQQRFVHVLVDEFQDINSVQCRILQLLTARCRNLFAVGDDDQSIYGFRGAAPETMLRFSKLFPGAETMYLSVNYRCPDRIVQAAGKSIAHNEQRLEKQIKGIGREPGEIRGFMARTREAQDACLRDWIRSLIKSGASPEQITVLVRNTSGAVRIEEVLNLRGIPVRGNGKGAAAWRRHPAVLPVYSYFAVAGGLGVREDYLRVLNAPQRHLPRCLLDGTENRFLWNYGAVMGEMKRHPSADAYMREQLEQIRAALDMIRVLPPDGALRYLCRACGYDDHIGEMEKEGTVLPGQWKNLYDKLLQIARQLETPAAFAEALRKEEPAGTERTGVAVQTIHAAKGLEYPYVAVADLTDGVFPSQRAGEYIDMEEERRLFYVALTRCSKSLLLTGYAEHLGKTYGPSLFFRELEEIFRQKTSNRSGTAYI